MRALLINPLIPRSFWSLEETVQIAGAKVLNPPLGLITMATLLPPDWQQRVVDLNAGPLPPGAWEWADLVMITGMLVQREGVLALSRENRH